MVGRLVLATTTLAGTREFKRGATTSARQRRWFKRAALFVMALTLSTALSAATLDPETAKAWDEYVASLNAAMQQRLCAGHSFLWADESVERLAAIRRGEVSVSPVAEQNPVKVPNGLIHHWVGAIFIPEATLDDVLETVRDYARYKELYRPGVVESGVLASGEKQDRFSMVLMSKVLSMKMALNADYDSSFVRLNDRSAYSITHSTRIQEIEDYRAPGQRLLPEDNGHGVLWRLFSIGRYVQRDGGVYLEMEVAGLSRDIPSALRWVIEPLVRRVSRSSLSTSLQQTQRAARSLAAEKSRPANDLRAVRELRTANDSRKSRSIREPN